MIQPYFDPTNYFRGGSVFSQYLEGFVKERSAMNKQMMEVALAQADPTFLQKQIQLMNENIIALEKAKAKAQAGDATANKQIFGLVKEFGKVGYIYEREKLLLDREMGGRAVAALASNKAAVQAALADSNNKNASAKEAALEQLFEKANTQFEQEALKLAMQEVVNEKVHKISLSDIEGYGTGPEQRKTAFIKKYDKDATLTPLSTKVDEIIKIAQDRSGAMTPANRQAVNDQIDAAIKKYEKQRAGYEKQLADLQEGGVDPFAGFSRNYMLDNPFIQMSRSQGKVDALASAIEATQQQDFRTPFARVVRVPATPQSTLSGNTYDADDEGLAEAHAAYMQKLKEAQDNLRQSQVVAGGDFPYDMGFDYDSDFAIEKLKIPDEEVEEDDDGTDQPYDYGSRDYVPTVGDLSSSQVPSATPPPQPVKIGPPLTSPVRESNIFSEKPLEEFINQGQIQISLSDDGREILYTPHTPAAVDALLRQTRQTAGPGQVAYEVLPR